jgi:hypothetical protein
MISTLEGAEIGRSWFEAGAGNFLDPRWNTSIISATWEAEVGGSRSKDNPGKSSRSYLQTNTESKITGTWLKW